MRLATASHERISPLANHHSHALSWLQMDSGGPQGDARRARRCVGIHQIASDCPSAGRVSRRRETSGVIFWAEPTKSVVIAKEWLRELEKGTSKDGHDQMPLRKVLYRHRNDVYDLPARVQRRGLSHSPCEGEPLLWHAHRSDRVKWARIHKHGAAEVCGFVV